MKKELCPMCNSQSAQGTITSYDVKIIDKIIKIPNIKKYICKNCNYSFFSKKQEIDLEKKILKERTKLLHLYNEIINSSTYEEVKNDDFFYPLIINNLRKIRIEKGISQELVAHALNVSGQRYSEIERNFHTPSIFIVSKLKEILRVNSIEKLFFVELIPASLFIKLRDSRLIIENEKEPITVKLEEIKGIQEARKKLQQFSVQYEEINKKYIEYKNAFKKQKKIQSMISNNIPIDPKCKRYTISNKQQELLNNPENFILLKREREILREKKEAARKEFADLEKYSVLQHGYCIESVNWDLIKKINNIK